MIALDIETVRLGITDEDKEAFEAEYSPPGNYKDPAKIEAHKVEAWSKWCDKVHWTTHEMITWATYDGYDIDADIADEAGVDRLVKRLENGGKIVTFNGVAFDIPIMLKKLSCEMVTKFRRNDIIDLWAWPLDKSCGLKAAAKAYGLRPDVDDIDGSMVAKLYAINDIKTILEYNMSDAKLTYQLAERLGYFYDLG
jgi:DNA polymerase elongation subunit (family B)